MVSAAGGGALGQQYAQAYQSALAQNQANYQNMTPEQRAAATRAFLGLGAEPDKAAAARGAPLFQRNCAFCHGPQARGATGPSLVTSDQVLGDDHGEKLVPYIRKGVVEKGMPAFASMSEDKLKDIAEFLHLQVEQVANRGAYQVLNIVVGNPVKGQASVAAHCNSCHAPESFARKIWPVVRLLSAISACSMWTHSARSLRRPKPRSLLSDGSPTGSCPWMDALAFVP